MPLNASVLCLLVALAIGGAAALLGLDACRLASAALPGLQPAASSTAPGLCLAWAAGLAVSALRRRRTPLVLGGSGRAAGSAAIAGRWLAAAAAGAFGAPPWLAAWTSPTPPLSEPLRAVAAALPFAPALFCLGAALPPLLAVRARGAALTRGVLGPLLAWLALGAVAAGWRWLPLLAAGARPTDLAAGVLAAAALLCGALAGAAPPDRPQAAGGPSRAPRGVRAWAAELELVVTGAACGLVLPALLQMAAVTGGDNLATRGELALLLACGALLGTLLAATPERTDLLGAALAWIVFAQWAPHVPEPSARFGGGLRALLPALLPTLLVVDTLIRAADRALATQPETGDAATGAPATLPHADGASRRGWALRCALLVGALGAGAAACSALSSGARGHGAPELLRACGLLAAALLALLSLALRRPQRARLAPVALVALVVLLLGMLFSTGAPASLPPAGASEELDAPEGTVPLLARRMGRISASLQPGAERALVLGLGSGLLPASLAEASPASVDIVEASRARLALLAELPWETRHGARGGPPALTLADPRAWLLEHPHAYDLVVGQPAVPDRARDDALHAVEHALAMRAALRVNGVAVQWYSLERLPWPAFASAARAFLAVFPDARLFVASLRADVPLVALAGGLSRGLPRREAVDELLAAAPSAAGPPAWVDLLDLAVCDAWTLLGRLRDEPVDTASQPWAALRSERRAADHALIARTNLRLLAELAQPLDTTSFEARPIDDKENRQLGAELTARSAALGSLLVARAAWLELRDTGRGGLSDAEHDALESQLGGALLFAWKAAPGHLDVRDTLVEWAAALMADERWEVAGTLLQSAIGIAPDARLLGGLGGVLLHVDHAEQALELLRRARELDGGDRTVLVNLGTAELFVAQDAAALGTLQAARAAMAPAPLPPGPRLALALLEAEPGAAAIAGAFAAKLPPGSPWRRSLERLLAAAPPPANPPAGG